MSNANVASREWEYRRSLQHEGTGARMLAFLEKAKSGRPFTVSVVGGSSGSYIALSSASSPCSLLRVYRLLMTPHSVSKGRGLVPPTSIPSDLHPRRRLPTRTKRSTIRRTSEDGFPPRAVSHPLDPLPHIASSPALGAHTLYSPENMHVLIFEWLNQTFPHPENRFVNGAQGGVGASYFGWCFRESNAFCALPDTLC